MRACLVIGGILGTPEAPEGLLVGERLDRRLLYRVVLEWGVRRAVIADVLERAPAVGVWLPAELGTVAPGVTPPARLARLVARHR